MPHPVAETLHPRYCSFRRRWFPPERRGAAAERCYPRVFAAATAAATAAWPSLSGEAWKAAYMDFRAALPCICARSESKSALRVLILASEALDKARNSPSERNTAFGTSCLVMTTMPPWIAFSSTWPKSLFASVAVNQANLAAGILRSANAAGFDRLRFGRTAGRVVIRVRPVFSGPFVFSIRYILDSLVKTGNSGDAQQSGSNPWPRKRRACWMPAQLCGCGRLQTIRQTRAEAQRRGEELRQNAEDKVHDEKKRFAAPAPPVPACRGVCRGNCRGYTQIKPGFSISNSLARRRRGAERASANR